MAKIMLVSSYFHPKIGGVERYVYNLAVGLRERWDHDVQVVTTGQDRTVTRAEVEGIPVTRLPVLATISATPVHPVWVVQVRRLLERERPDVINTHAPVPGLADVSFAVRGKRPLIATYHSGSMKKGSGALDLAIGAYEATALKWIMRRADELVTTFPPDRPGGRADPYHIPPGVDPGIFYRSPDATHEAGTLLYVGRIELASAWKGIGTLLVAMRRVLGSRPDVRLRLVGEGDAVPHFREKAKELGIGETVEFVGALHGQRLADAYRRAEILVLPSETEAESFGMVLIEAMACGTPVVASRVGGVPAVVRDTGGGLLTEPGNPASLAEGILALLADPLRRRTLADAGAARVAARYTWDVAVDAYQELIKKLTG